MAGLYVHIPFCTVKCAYCDFYSGPLRNFDAEAYVEAALSELQARRGEVEVGKDGLFDTIYIGGGTPSAISPSLLRQFLALGKPGAEITVEANPEDVTRQWADGIVEAGANRVSMGVQSLVDSELRTVGRRHTAARAIEATATLREAGIGNISLDLIYGLPGQTVNSWRRSLDGVIGLGVEHLSAYLLSIEPGTRLYAGREAGKFEEATEETVEQMYAMLCKSAADAGFEHYEISNFARPGMHSRHNSSYWDFTPYLGLGPGAHSFDGKLRRFNPPDLRKYLLSPSTAFEIEEPEEHSLHNDMVFTSLRTARGLDPSALNPSELPDAQRLLTLTDEGRYRIDESRWLTSNSIISAFLRV